MGFEEIVYAFILETITDNQQAGRISKITLEVVKQIFIEGYIVLTDLFSSAGEEVGVLLGVHGIVAVLFGILIINLLVEFPDTVIFFDPGFSSTFCSQYITVYTTMQLIQPEPVFVLAGIYL